MKFRSLKPDEVDCRVSQVFNEKDGSIKGITLLLYKDARCDMNILDESGVIWQRKHYELKGNIYASVGIYNEDVCQFIWRDDCGKESYTEKEKGESSDSFKRACVNWGIGRELYTSPLIYIPSVDYNKQPNFEQYNNKGKMQPKANFSVKEMTVEDGVISKLVIENTRSKKVIFSWDGGK